MQGVLGSLNYFLFGLAVVGGLDVIFRGPPLLGQESSLFDSEEEREQFREELLRVKTKTESLRQIVENQSSAMKQVLDLVMQVLQREDGDPDNPKPSDSDKP